MDKQLYTISPGTCREPSGSRSNSGPARLIGPTLFLLLILFLAPSTSLAAGQAGSGLRPGVVGVSAPLMADSWGVRQGIGTAWHFVESGLSDRRRMIQLATIGMCIGLYIMMRR